MTKNGLKNRIVRVKGLKLMDPWGEMALVWDYDFKADTVWLLYGGISVPFERSLEACVLAANGQPLADRSVQFVRRLVGHNGMGVTLHYEKNWVSAGVSSMSTARPTIESLQGSRKRPLNRRKN